MEKIEFTKDLELGIGPIDSQHRRLIDLINSLLEMSAVGASREVLGEILDELSEYIFEHFEAEESLMQEAGYPGYAAHREQHAGFVKKFISFHAKFRAGEERLEVDILSYLAGWLVHHISGEDPLYAAHCQSLAR